MEFYETNFQVLQRILRNTVRITESAADLDILDGCQLVNDAVARLGVIGDAAIGVQVLVRQFEIVALRDAPIGLEQSRELAGGLRRQALVIVNIDLSQPGNGSGT